MLLNTLSKKLKLWEAQQLKRARRVISHREYQNNGIIIDGKPCINFSSSDYLGLTQHPAIQDATIEGVKRYGMGSGAAPMVSGYFDVVENLENAFKDWLKVDSAVFFNCGYTANLGVLLSLLGRQDVVFSDKLCHASLLDGIQLSRAKHYRYRHKDMLHLEKMATYHQPNLIVTESVFSMRGSLADVRGLHQVAEKYEAEFIVDDAHGIGVLGKEGRGILEQASLDQTQFSCLILPFGKAFNAMGAMVVGRKEIIEMVLQFSRTYRYSTALPPAISCAVQAALKIIQEESWRRDVLHRNIAFFNWYFQEKKFEEKNISLLSNDETPVRMIRIGDNAKTMAIQASMWEEGFYVAAIRPPSVPDAEAALRISLNCLHTEEQITLLLDKIAL